ncbi:hypothetical protein [Bradyrhizobium sp. 6(2017)]|uniref:hypothetical protein n=1 Tax=Bradyrhizobium sp. 6(2017) TaxID=1197460 RepID=UPI0013E1DCA1|nr:hypothetical protein [Bradyrhizobium sp. 6(2017)]QIG96788.1 hypothetical protein G6P99_33210 [Bradyrhizobium sp. 6(2017)]
MGFVELNKVDYGHTPRELEWVRNGVEAARELAEQEAERKGGKPPRRTNSEAMARKREFNEAVRQRIREVGVVCELSQDDIKPALTIKHQDRPVPSAARDQPRMAAGEKGVSGKNAAVERIANNCKMLSPSAQKQMKAAILDMLAERPSE